MREIQPRFILQQMLELTYFQTKLVEKQARYRNVNNKVSNHAE